MNRARSVYGINRVFLLLLVFVFAFVLPVWASEQKVSFEWSYPEDQNKVISGFRIYQQLDSGKVSVITTINNATSRKVIFSVDVDKGDYQFFVAPFIGNREGEPSNIDGFKIRPFYPISTFKAVCTTCGE